MTVRRALIILAEGAEEMEVVIVADVLRRANVKVTLAGLLGNESVKCARETVITPDASFEEASKEIHDVLILPGGLGGSETLAKTASVGEAMKHQLSSGGWLAAICAAPIAIAAHNVKPGATLTSYPGVKEKLVQAGYNYSEDRVVVDDKLVTSRGPGTAFEFALKLVQLLINEETAEKHKAAMLLL